MLAKSGETACGDGYDYLLKGNRLKFVISDGLGHGEDASIATTEGLNAFQANITATPAEQIKLIHKAIRKTRGAVMSIVHFDFSNKQMVYCGVGNIAAKLLPPVDKYKTCISYNGIVGHSVPGTLNNHPYQWTKSDIFIAHSDGISSRWDLQKYPGIHRCDPSILLAALYKDYERGNDDVSVVVITQNNPSV